MRPTSSRSRACRTCCRPRPTRRGPTRVNTLDEHLDMLMVCHHLDAVDPRGRRLRREPHPQGDHRRRGHPARPRRALDDVVGQPGHGPGRRGDHPHLADRAQDEGAARPPARRRRATTTTSASSATSPSTRSTRRSRMACRTHIGSVEVGKLADLVLWSPAFFGVKPDLVIKGGIDRRRADGRSQRLDPDAAAGALPADVRRLRPGAARAPRVTFVSQGRARRPACASKLGVREAARRRARTRAAASPRSRMIHNDATPDIEVDPETYEVRADGELLTCEPADGAADGAALLPVLTFYPLPCCGRRTSRPPCGPGAHSKAQASPLSRHLTPLPTPKKGGGAADHFSPVV